MTTLHTSTSPVTYVTVAPTVKIQAYVNRKARQWSRFSMRAAIAWQKYDDAIELRKPLAEVKALGEKADCFEECQLAAHKLWDYAHGLLLPGVN